MLPFFSENLTQKNGIFHFAIWGYQTGGNAAHFSQKKISSMRFFNFGGSRNPISALFQKIWLRKMEYFILPFGVIKTGGNAAHFSQKKNFFNAILQFWGFQKSDFSVCFRKFDSEKWNILFCHLGLSKQGEMLPIFLKFFLQCDSSILGSRKPIFTGKFGGSVQLCKSDVTRGNAAHFSQFSFLGLSTCGIRDYKQGEMLPIFKLSVFSSSLTSDFIIRIGGNAARFAPIIFLDQCNFRFGCWEKGKLCTFSWKYLGGQLKFSDRGKCCPFFPNIFWISAICRVGFQRSENSAHFHGTFLGGGLTSVIQIGGNAAHFFILVLWIQATSGIRCYGRGIVAHYFHLSFVISCNIWNQMLWQELLPIFTQHIFMNSAQFSEVDVANSGGLLPFESSPGLSSASEIWCYK